MRKGPRVPSSTPRLHAWHVAQAATYTIAVIGVWCYSSYKRAQQAAKAKAAKAAESLTSGREMSERGLTEAEDGETFSEELAPESTPALHETIIDEDVKAVRVPLSRAA